MPGVQRTTGSVVNPGGGGPQIGVPAIPQQGLGYTSFGIHNGIPGIGYGQVGPFGQSPYVQRGHGHPGGGGRRGNHGGNSEVYAYPVFVGGGYYGSDYSDNGYGAPPPVEAPVQQQQQPSVIVIYPPAASATPVTIYPSETGTPEGAGPSSTLYPAQPAQPSAEASTAGDEATHYLIAFKDHTIYSAVAYWVDGDTLHYFTSGNTHNQASLSLVDRALTEKLNKDSGLQVKLPPAK